MAAQAAAALHPPIESTTLILAAVQDVTIGDEMIAGKVRIVAGMGAHRKRRGVAKLECLGDGDTIPGESCQQ